MDTCFKSRLTPFMGICLVGLFVATCSGVLVRRASVRSLIGYAPIVVKGQVTAVSDAPGVASPFPGFGEAVQVEVQKATIKLEYKLKGELQNGEILVFFLKENLTYSFTSLEVGNTYLLFLSKCEAGFRFHDPQNGALPVLKGKPEKIEGDPFEMARVELERSLGTQERTLIRLALPGLASIGDARSLEKIKPYTSSPDEAIRIRAVAAALALGEWQYAEQLVRFVDAHYRPETHGFHYTGDVGMHEIPWHGYLRAVTNEAAAPLFLKLLKQSKSPDLRSLLAASLTSMHSPDVLPFLIEMLRDKNEDIAYSAYASIMEIRGQARSSSDKFGREKGRIIQEIEHWAASQAPR